MGVRDMMNRSPRLAVGIAVGLLATGVALLVLQGRNSQASNELPQAAKAWYTTDDGKTWFADELTKTPPFSKDGKTAVRAYVFRAPDGTEFVGFLERYTPEGKRAVEAAWTLPPEQQGTDPTMAGGSDQTEVKKPGQANWVPVSSPAADQVYKVVSPKGQSEGLKMIDPE